MKISVNVPDTAASKEAIKKVKAKKAIPTMEESWELIFSRKNTPKDLERLKEVKEALEEGSLEREHDKLQKAFTKAEAMRLYQVLQEKNREEKFNKLAAADLELYPLITKDNIVDWTKRAINADDEYIAMDFETVGDHGGTDKYSEKISGYSLTFRFNGVIENGYVPIRHRLEDGTPDPRNVPVELAENCIKGVFHSDKATVWHNASFDLGLAKASLDLEVKTDVHDTLIIMHLLDEDLPSYQLKKLATDFLNMPSETFEEMFGKSSKFADVPLMIARWYAAKDTYVGFLLFEWQMSILNKPNFAKIKKVYERIERPCIMVTFEAEAEGFIVDMKEVEIQRDETESRIAELQASLKERFGDINYNSSSQLQKMLYFDNDWSAYVTNDRKSILKGHVGFDEHGISNNGKFAMKPNGSIILDPILEEVKAGFDNSGNPLTKVVAVPKNPRNKLQADSKALKKISNGVPEIKDLLELKDLTKHLTGFVNAMDRFIAPDGKLHGQFNQVGTVTLRYSASNPNLQQQSKPARKMFTVDEDSTIIGADFSGQELRLLGHISGDAAIKKVYADGIDFYSSIASTLFNKPYEEVGDGTNERKQAKMIVLAVLYGMGGSSLGDILKISKDEAQSFIDKFLDSYPTVKKWIEGNKHHAIHNRYVETIFGTRRRFKKENFNVLDKPWGKLTDYEKDLRSAASRALRQATNAIVQGSAAQQTKATMVAMKDLLEELSAKRGKKRCFNFLAFIHDEALFKAPKDVTKEEIEAIRNVMETTIKLSIPSATDMEIGSCWGTMNAIDYYFDIPCGVASFEASKDSPEYGFKSGDLVAYRRVTDNPYGDYFINGKLAGAATDYDFKEVSKKYS